MSEEESRRPGRLLTGVLLVVLGAVIGASVALWGQRSGEIGRSGQTVVLGDSDVEFAHAMQAHHEQAITMVGLLSSDVGEVVRATADQIAANQWREIGQMTGWLESAGTDLEGRSHGHVGAAPHHEEGAHGMATGEELSRLQHVRGTEQEILFVQLMIRHHQGAVDMIDEAMPTLEAPPVRRAATMWVSSQSEEIGLLSVVLDGLGAEPLPYG